MTQKPTYEELEKRVRTLEAENRHLKKAEQQCASNEAHLQSLIEIIQYPARSVQETLELALEKAIALTGSKIGYIYHYDPESEAFILNNWSKGAMDACAITNPDTVYKLAETGIWGEAVRQAKPIVINDYKAPHPLKKGYPKGHAELHRYMTVPVVHEDRIVAVVGAANKDSDYTYSDVLHITLLMDTLWTVVAHKQAVESLRKSEELLRKTQEIAKIGSWELDAETGVLTWSGQVYRIFGMNEDKCPITYETFLEAVHPDDRRTLDRAFSESIEAGSERYETEHRLIRQDTGEIRHVHEKCEHVKDPSGKIIRSVGMAADITERKQAEDRLRKFNAELERRVRERTAELKKRTRQLQRLALALSQAEDRERQKMSQVLHEDLQQMLASARLQIDIIESTENIEHRDIMLRKTREMLQESLQKTRNLSHDLSPPILSYAGLKDALDWLAKSMDDRHGLKIDLETADIQRPRSRTVEMFLFRSARELLFNVVKHADVKKARITLESSDDGFYLTIADEGRGFDPAMADSGHSGIGIYSIRERIDLMGGKFEIQSTPGKGTTTVIFLPDAEPQLQPQMAEAF